MNLTYPAIVIADTHNLFCSGFKELLQHHFTNSSVTLVTDADKLLHAAAQQSFDIILIDACLPPANGFEPATRLMALKAEHRIIIYSHEYNQQLMIEAFAAGAGAYFCTQQPQEIILFKLTETLKNGFCIMQEDIDAYRAAQQRLTAPPGTPALTAAEKKILQHVAQGLSNRQIAALLFRSVKTVENHRQHIMKKAKCHNTVVLLEYARKVRWI